MSYVEVAKKRINTVIARAIALKAPRCVIARGTALRDPCFVIARRPDNCRAGEAILSKNNGRKIARNDGAGEDGQVSMEVGFALIAAFTLIIGTAVIFSYVNSRLVLREEAYESSAQSGRIVAGAPANDQIIEVDEEGQLPKLDIFNKGG